MEKKISKTTSKALPHDYKKFLTDIKSRVRQAQTKASLAVNSELTLLYWQIGKSILAKQEQEGWGAQIVNRLAKDLSKEFPGQKGFTSRNLLFMRGVAEAFPEEEIVKQLVSQIPWGHTIRLIQMVKNPEIRKWYVHKTIEQGWSRNVLVHQIESGLYERQGSAQTNFDRALPHPQSELAGQMLKCPYNFDFLTLGEKYREAELQKGLLDHLRSFLLELGVGFAFVGSEYHLKVGESDFYLDLLFYHLKLRAYIVLELKRGKFIPEYAGKMSFYLTAVDELLRHQDDKPTIGIILCKGKDGIVAEYALRDIDKPIGISQFELTQALPEELKSSLPTIEQLEGEFEER